MKLAIPQNEVTTKIFNEYRVGGDNGRKVDVQKGTIDGYDAYVFYDKSGANFDAYYGTDEDGKEPGNTPLPKFFEDVLTKCSVGMAKTKGIDTMLTSVANDSFNGFREYLVDRDRIILTSERWDREYDNLYDFEINRIEKDVKSEMRERAFGGELSEDTRPYLTDEEFSDLMLQAQKD